MASLGKKGKTSFSRGYCGYHTTWEGNKIYLRSKLEFLYATWLDFNKIKYKVEVCFYEVENRNYKPDFFLYNQNNELIKIVEIKGKKAEKESYLKQFFYFFENILKVSYEVFYLKELNNLVKNIPDIKNKTENWINYCVKNENILDMRGKNNPRYGSHGTLEGNKKISETNKKIKSNPEWKKKFSEQQKEYFKTEAGKIAIEKRRKKMLENGVKIREKTKLKKQKICPICNSVFYASKKTCSVKCSYKLISLNSNPPNWTKEQIKARYQTKLKNVCNKIILELNLSLKDFFKDPDKFIKKAKESNIIYNKLGISLKTLNKYEVKEILWEN
jgi:hypothetical protein